MSSVFCLKGSFQCRVECPPGPGSRGSLEAGMRAGRFRAQGSEEGVATELGEVVRFGTYIDRSPLMVSGTPENLNHRKVSVKDTGNHPIRALRMGSPGPEMPSRLFEATCCSATEDAAVQAPRRWPHPAPHCPPSPGSPWSSASHVGEFNPAGPAETQQQGHFSAFDPRRARALPQARSAGEVQAPHLDPASTPSLGPWERTASVNWVCR